MPSPALLKLDHGPNSNPPSRRGSMAAIQSLGGLSMESSVQSPYVKEALKRATMQLEVLESAKRLAAYTAVDHHILPEHTVIGIGSGSTVPYVVDRIIQQGDKLNKNRVFIPTGFQSKELIVRGGLKLGDVDQYPTIDVTIDGADEQLNCLKGGGACHLREKVLAEAADIFVIVADYRKNTGLLGKSVSLLVFSSHTKDVNVRGEKWKQGVPIEVAPFAYAKLLQNLHRLGSPEATLRMAKMKAGPIVTDNGNFCIDAPFDEAYMQDPHDLLAKIKMLTGVVEVGLFCGMAKAAYFGNEDGSVSVRYENGTSDTISASAVE
ncbi:ribose 5-phosphate isomerase A [Rhizoctonia solani]|uniref:Ribose-5-phosphate isomerase n=1 Tax=Rhizoctonia solani TaxID=456999 RepID=A0A8H8NXV7_9AGAM|nr:ribose 5-phosphate isomerase A [Rhizoctonia solani]QRW20670.1 ribose 5-phosphate isomerase A [Rhizoctonia solani]